MHLLHNRLQSITRAQALHVRLTHTLPKSPSKVCLAPTHTPSVTSPKPQTLEVLELTEKYLLPVYARPDFVLSHGKGSYVWDLEGRKYLDFSAGIAVNALGHADEGVCEVIASQSAKLVHTSNAYHHIWSSKLAELLVELTRAEGGLGLSTSSGDARVFFSNSGTEANEGALKIARSFGKVRMPNKTRIVCFEQSFHGRSIGALSVTSNPKYQKPFEPLIPGVDVGTLNKTEGLNELITDETCAVIVEPIQGEGGVNVADESWLRAIRERCDLVGALLIFDEIQCGLFRTGKLWAHSWYNSNCHPDIVTMAKPLANGYPIGAVLMRDKVTETMTVGTHGTTFGGSPLACAVGHHVLSRLSQPGFVSQLQEAAGYLKSRLELLPQWFPGILEEKVRGRGLIVGLGFKDTSMPGQVVGLARERGLFVLTAGIDAVRIVPSLTIGEEEVDGALAVLESVLQLAAEGTSG